MNFYTVYHYAECRYAECHYDECCGAVMIVSATKGWLKRVKITLLIRHPNVPTQFNSHVI